MTPTHRHASLQGIGFAVLATACFATLDTTTRHVSAGLSVMVALWFRYAIQAIITTVVVKAPDAEDRAARLLRATKGRTTNPIDVTADELAAFLRTRSTGKVKVNA